MNVHVVTVDAGRDNIFGRILAPLLVLDGWTHGHDVRRDADINLFFPYLQMEGKRLPEQGVMASWFTHRDVGRPEKVRMWDDFDRQSHLRMACADLYLTQLTPPVFKVTAFIDLPHFTPGASPRPKGVVGTSGYVYPEGRKGEALYAELAADILFAGTTFMATTPGWGVPTRPRGWDAMPNYYRGLSVYVCTSLIEGTGHGPLEALACGVPVVVPTGVGIFDELYSPAPAIFRYPAGDYLGLAQALDQALEYSGDARQDECREVVSKFTVEAWVGDITRALSAAG